MIYIYKCVFTHMRMNRDLNERTISVYVYFREMSKLISVKHAMRLMAIFEEQKKVRKWNWRDIFSKSEHIFCWLRLNRMRNFEEMNLGHCIHATATATNEWFNLIAD